MCGEKMPTRYCGWRNLGSPPHVRGKAVKLAQYFDVTGITPACAGKSPSFRMISNKNGDHPRMCGEKLTMVHPCLRLKGSPPHVRGKDTPIGETGAMSGITPACAGKSSGRMQRSGTNGDHPRMCGEKVSFFYALHDGLGSPPHVRGKD